MGGIKHAFGRPEGNAHSISMTTGHHLDPRASSC
jgi:hypothetical protein